MNYKNSVVKGSPKGIRTFAILTGENTASTKATRRVNRQNNKFLREILKEEHITYTPAYGKFAGNPENSYFLLNPKFDQVRAIAGRFNQTSFIWGVVEDGEMVAYYWELEDNTKPYASVTNDYVEKDEVARVERKEGATDNFSRLGKALQFSFPFPIFDAVDKAFLSNMSDSAKQSLALYGVGMASLKEFRTLHRGVQNIIDDNINSKDSI